MRNVRWRIIPLPEWHVAGLAAGFLLNLLVPWRLPKGGSWGVALGWLLMLLGTALTVWAWARVAAADLNVRHGNRVVTQGPYAHGRNPMYVGWSLIYIGISLVLDTAWTLVFLPPVLLLTHLGVLREEQELARRFGSEYTAYKMRVRRYL